MNACRATGRASRLAATRRRSRARLRAPTACAYRARVGSDAMARPSRVRRMTSDHARTTAPVHPTPARSSGCSVATARAGSAAGEETRHRHRRGTRAAVGAPSRVASRDHARGLERAPTPSRARGRGCCAPDLDRTARGGRARAHAPIPSRARCARGTRSGSRRQAAYVVATPTTAPMPPTTTTLAAAACAQRCTRRRTCTGCP